MADALPDPRPTLQQQIDEVECCALTAEARARIKAQTLAGGRPYTPDTGCTASGAASLRAAVETLTWVRDHAEAIRAVVRGGEGTA